MGDQRQMQKQQDQSVKSSLFAGVKSFFTKGKKNADKNAKGRGRAQTELDFIPPKFEQQEDQMPKKKLPKNFAERVLDLELKIDGGNFDIKNIDKLMQLYSMAVEYYSGMNDEKYMYFTERIQNTLLKPEIMKLYD